MLPPPGLEPSLASLLENATPTVASVVATATSLLTSPTIAAAVATAAALADQDQDQDHAHGAAGGPHHGPPGDCQLLGPFAILVQGALGCCALLALVYKRWRERPQRPVKIWFFDVSKQVVGSVLVHIANLLMSMLSSGQFTIRVDPAVVAGPGGKAVRSMIMNTALVRRVALGSGIEMARRMVDEEGHFRPNPCSFYLLNLAIDTTVGIPILILLLRLLTILFSYTSFGHPLESITSGNYGSPPKATWWFKQSIIYFIGLMGMKICVLVVFLVAPWIGRVGDWALRWTEGDEVLQVVFVMLVFPVIMNATQYYIIDSFIKDQAPGEHEHLQGEDVEEHHQPTGRYDDPEHTQREESLFSEDEDEEPKNGEGDDLRPKKIGSGSMRTKRSPGLVTHGDYDPVFDGDNTPTVVGSASESSRGLMSAGKEEGMDEETKRPESSR